jgi:folate-dependent phosphoribosylglycinamide formyltransferase PurN
MRLAVLAPIANSLYSRLVVHLAAREPGVELVLVVVRSIASLKRFRDELRRDGRRLVEKIYHKLVLSPADQQAFSGDTLAVLAAHVHLKDPTLPAQARRLGVRCLQVKDHNHPAALHALQAARPDIIAFTGGGLIRQPILDLPRLGVLNCHAGLLPEYRGMDVVEWPLLEMQDAAPRLGITLHFMDRGVDTGPILLTRALSIQPGDTLERFRARLEPAQVTMVLDGLRGLRDGTLQPRPQLPEDGRQYYMLHPRLRAAAARRLSRLAVPVSVAST